jgi:hypothetical protein
VEASARITPGTQSELTQYQVSADLYPSIMVVVKIVPEVCRPSFFPSAYTPSFLVYSRVEINHEISETKQGDSQRIVWQLISHAPTRSKLREKRRLNKKRMLYMLCYKEPH